MKKSHANKNDAQMEHKILELNQEAYASMDLSYYEGEDEIRHRLSWENIARVDNILKSIYENTEGEIALDVGVGSGFCLLRELKIFPRCIGLDLSLEMALQKGIPKSLLVKGNSYQMPFGSEVFGLVSAHSLLHHLVNIPQFFSEAYRVLKKGGYLYTDADKNIYNIKLLRIFKMAQYSLAEKRHKGQYEYWRDILIHRESYEYHDMGLDFIELERVLKKIGFQKVILTPIFSVNPIYNMKLTFRVMKKIQHCFNLKSSFTHIQFLAIK